MFFVSVHLKYKYPMDDKDQEQMRWKAILSKLNAKCRSFRRPPHNRGRRAGSTSSAVSSEGAGSVSDVNNSAATPDHIAESPAIPCELIKFHFQCLYSSWCWCLCH